MATNKPEKLKSGVTTKAARNVRNRNDLNRLAVRQAFGVNRTLFARMVGASERTLATVEAGKQPSPAVERRLREFHRLHKALAEVMQPDYIPDWLTAPNDGFDGLKPLEVIERGEIDRIWEMIYYLRSGVPV